MRGFGLCQSFSNSEVLNWLVVKMIKMISLPMEMSEVLYSIEKLKITGCLQLVQVFGNDSYIQRCASLKNMNQMTATRFSKLVDLQVHWLQWNDKFI